MATVYLMCIGFIAFNVARSVYYGVPVTPDNAGAENAAKRDRGYLRAYKPGDTWTYSYTSHTQNDLVPDTHGHGYIVETIGETVANGQEMPTDTKVFFSHLRDGTYSKTEVVSYYHQDSNCNLYVLGVGDGDSDDTHWNSQEVLNAKANWNQDASIETLERPGNSGHLTVTVDPAPVVRTLSTGTPIKCWNEKSVVAHDGHVFESVSSLFCPAIGQPLDETEVIYLPDEGTHTITSHLLHYSLRS